MKDEPPTLDYFVPRRRDQQRHPFHLRMLLLLVLLVAPVALAAGMVTLIYYAVFRELRSQ